MRIETFGLALAAIVVIPATSADAAVVAKWTMATAITSATTGSNYTYGAADQGENASGSSLSGYHAQANAAWTTPSGNGSTYSLSSDKWSQGDYYQIVVQTTGDLLTPAIVEDLLDTTGGRLQLQRSPLGGLQARVEMDRER